mmetsp:Transcript_5778/g.10985  ORF Transcript_5778/g.10985 Transcript_5778/m.10985 type:complete len:108 (-) Transcript_5778:143-466(-)
MGDSSSEIFGVNQRGDAREFKQRPSSVGTTEPAVYYADVAAQAEGGNPVFELSVQGSKQAQPAGQDRSSQRIAHLCVISVVVGYLASSAYVRRKKRMRALEGRDVDL